MPYPHMPRGSYPSPVTGYRSTVVRYVATGTEGTSFNVPFVDISTGNAFTMTSATYGVAWTPAGGTGAGGASSGVEILDVPLAGRQVGQCQVIVGQALAAGDVLELTITGTVS